MNIKIGFKFLKNCENVFVEIKRKYVLNFQLLNVKLKEIYRKWYV